MTDNWQKIAMDALALVDLLSKQLDDSTVVTPPVQVEDATHDCLCDHYGGTAQASCRWHWQDAVTSGVL